MLYFVVTDFRYFNKTELFYNLKPKFLECCRLFLVLLSANHYLSFLEVFIVLPILKMHFPFELEYKRRNELRDYEPTICKMACYFLEMVYTLSNQPKMIYNKKHYEL